ncbi:HAD-IA family hydrolase [Micromonospora fluostatini]|uniref:HAD-IA family hydrolase n=1 Tax=Micromonospora sp. JCM 30529 TaxID=3421643 RepID=UPI003D17BE3F
MSPAGAGGSGLVVTVAGEPAPIHCDALLFDMDGTLVDSRECVERKWRAWCARHGLDAEALLRRSHGRQLADTVRLAAPHLDLDREVTDLVRWEERDTTGLVPVPGAVDLLAALPADRWAVVTSAWRRLAEIRLGHVGLPVPACLVTADDVGRGKPAPDGYLAAAARLGHPPGRCVVLEDSRVGVRAGRAAGMWVIGVATTVAPSRLDADRVVRDLSVVRVDRAVSPRVDGAPAAGARATPG